MDATENTDDDLDNGTISQIIGAPLQFVRRIIPSYGNQDQTGSSVEEVEMVGDKLRRKRMKSKRRSGTTNIRDYRGSYSSRRRKQLGSNRSVVRYIGSNAPIAPSRRACFEYFDHSRKAILSHASTLISSNLDQMRQHVDHVKLHVVPSLADLGQLVWEDGFDEMEQSDVEQIDETESSEPIEFNLKPSSATDNSSTGEGTKITELEDELAKLRAQIAMIVSNQVAGASSSTVPVAVVPPTTAGQPTTTAPPPPPPPPPVPPPLPLSGISVVNTKSETVKCAPQSKTVKCAPQDSAPQPNMNDILKGIANVKLKTVDINRSPGGTPARKKVPREDSTNPADIIAKALREKFKTKVCYDSPEGDSSPQSGFTPSPKGKNHKKSPRVHSRAVRPIPRPRPRPKPRTQKRTKIEEKKVAQMDSLEKESLVFD